MLSIKDCEEKCEKNLFKKIAKSFYYLSNNKTIKNFFVSYQVLFIVRLNFHFYFLFQTLHIIEASREKLIKEDLKEAW
jgi:hypothetical protein